jgi:hypothetical protein
LTGVEEADTSPATLHEPCPACGADRSGDDRYCEGCGYDFLAPPATVAAWETVAEADRAQFDRCAMSGLSYPADYVERRYAIDGTVVRIGRGKARPDGPQLEIDLAGDPEDPGISHLHAVLERSDDGSYAVRDLGSTNGTTVNNDPNPIDSDVAVPLADGDRIHVGAWTTLTLRKR